MGQVHISSASLWVCFILGKQLNFVQNYVITAISNILWSFASDFFPNNFKVAQNIKYIIMNIGVTGQIKSQLKVKL